jgi:putative ABC transport system permease protein
MNPNWNHIVREHLAVLRLPSEREIEIVEELALHLEAAYEDALADGLSEAEAEARAVQGYDWQLLECEVRRAEQTSPARALQPSLELIEQTGRIRMESILHDVRFGVRMLINSPAFTLAAILSLAIGIGANTALFSVVNAVLWSPLPYPGAERLVRVGEGGSAEVFAVLRQTQRTFDGLAGWKARDFMLTGRGWPAHLRGERITPELLPLLGVTPQAGRAFLPEEFQPGRDQVALISNRLWQSRFGADPQIIGQAVTLDQRPYTVVGVLPPRFDFFPEADLLTPLALTAVDLSNPDYGLRIVARLKPGLTLEQARQEMARIAPGLEERRNALIQQRDGKPDVWRFDAQRELRLQPLRELLVKDFRLTLLALWGVVGFVLLIACANVANLMLARAANRQKELAIRAAIGARRARLARQLLTESVLVALAGGALGLLSAYLGVQALLKANPAILPQLGRAAAMTTIPRLSEVAINEWALAFNFGLALLTGVLFGLAPALQFSRPDVHYALKEGAAVSSRGFRFRLRRGTQSLLVIGEVALALVLLVGAGLMIRSLWRLQQIEPGFQPDRLLTLQLEFPASRYQDSAQVMSFVTRLNERVAALPGVESISLADSLPLSPVGSLQTVFIDGKPHLRAKPDDPMYGHGASGPSAFLSRISPGYFSTLGIPLRQGREFGPEDRTGSLPVAIINEAMAHRYWPGENPLGKRLGTDRVEWRTIVGVVGNVRRLALEDQPKPEWYMPSLQPPGSGRSAIKGMKAGAEGSRRAVKIEGYTIAIRPMKPTATQGQASYISLTVRTSVRPEAVADAVRKTVWGLDPDQPILHLGAMQARLDQFYAPRRFNMLLFGVFALVALLLAAIGIYGVLAYMVTQRTHEIGIRIALGAQTRDVLWLIVRQGLALTLVGVVLGLTGALALTRVIRNLLYEVSATDPVTFAGIALLLIGVAFIASFIPARRATKVDPLTALRHE